MKQNITAKKRALVKQGIQMTGRFRFTIRDAATGKIKRVHHYENLITIAGRNCMLQNMFDATPDDSPLVNKFVLGTNVAAPTEASTQLGTEVFRNDIASRTASAEFGFATGFVDATEDADTYKEAGIVMDGTGTINTGILLSHVAIDVTKSLTETLTVDWELELTIP